MVISFRAGSVDAGGEELGVLNIIKGFFIFE